MPCCGVAEIAGGDVQIELRAGDQSMAEQIADGHQANFRAHQVSRKSVPQPMRGERKADAAALTPGTHAFVNAATRERASETRAKEGRGGERWAAGLRVDSEYLGEFGAQRDGSLVSTFAMHGDGQLGQIHLTTAQRSTFEIGRASCRERVKISGHG